MKKNLACPGFTKFTNINQGAVNKMHTNQFIGFINILNMAFFNFVNCVAQIKDNMKTAIITGGAVRLGRAIALALASDGWHIGFTYKSSAQSAASTQSELLGSGVAACSMRTDLRNEDEIRASLNFFAEQFLKTIIGKGVDIFFG